MQTKGLIMHKKIFAATLFSIAILASVTALTFMQMPREFENKLKPPVIHDVEIVKATPVTTPVCIDIACSTASNALPKPMGEVNADFVRGFCYAAQIANGMPFTGPITVGDIVFDCPKVPE